MEKTWGVPLNANNWLLFSLWDYSGNDWLTGAVIGDLQGLKTNKNGTNLGSHGLYMHEIGEGLYHFSNNSSASIPYISTAEEQILIRYKGPQGGWHRFSFWSYNLVGRIDTLLSDYFDAQGVAGVMSGFYFTQAELTARLTEVRAEITKCRKAQSAQTGIGNAVVRAQLRTLLDEEQWLLRIQAAMNMSTTGGASNRVQFARPA